MRPNLSVEKIAGALAVLGTGVLMAACGGDSLKVPTPPAQTADGGPAVSRTPFGQNGRPGTPGAPVPPTPPPAPQTYTVVGGDTANGIAAKLNVPSAMVETWVQQLLSMNNTTASTLQIGQVLRLPPGASAAPPPAS